MPYLISIAGMHLDRRFPLRDRLRVGRAVENDIVLRDHLVSRFHAEVLRAAGGFSIHDLGSKNGFVVNGQPTSERRLANGDEIRLGKTTLRVVLEDEAMPARFSDVAVRLTSDAGWPVEALELAAANTAGVASIAGAAGAAGTGGAGLMGAQLLHIAGRLLQCDHESLAEQFQRALGILMHGFGLQAAAILLRGIDSRLRPLVALAEGPELVLPASAAQTCLAESRPLRFEVPPGLPPRTGLLLPLPGRREAMGVVYAGRAGAGTFTAAEAEQLELCTPLLAALVRHSLGGDRPAATDDDNQPVYLGQSEAALAVLEQVRRTGQSDATALITGETGSGKELVARAVHEASRRGHGPFVVIDCSSIPPNLLESELFGHEAGAFTGADRLKRGKVELAEGGTLFLDEVGELQPELQPKLLRFLQDLTFYRVGGIRELHADVRVIAATNRDLEAAVEEERFRADLLYRLNVMRLRLPALRERPTDIHLLVEHFAPRLAARVGKPYLAVVAETWPLLEHYPWPGNVRELRHALERALILSDDGILRPEHFQLELPEPGREVPTDGGRTGTHEQTQPPTSPARPMPLSLAEAEKEAIRRALRFANGNRQRAAELLDIHRNTLTRKLQEYGLGD